MLHDKNFPIFRPIEDSTPPVSFSPLSTLEANTGLSSLECPSTPFFSTVLPKMSISVHVDHESRGVSFFCNDVFGTRKELDSIASRVRMELQLKYAGYRVKNTGTFDHFFQGYMGRAFGIRPIARDWADKAIGTFLPSCINTARNTKKASTILGPPEGELYFNEKFSTPELCDEIVKSNLDDLDIRLNNETHEDNDTQVDIKRYSSMQKGLFQNLRALCEATKVQLVKDFLKPYNISKRDALACLHLKIMTNTLSDDIDYFKHKPLLKEEDLYLLDAYIESISDRSDWLSAGVSFLEPGSVKWQEHLWDTAPYEFQSLVNTLTRYISKHDSLDPDIRKGLLRKLGRVGDKCFLHLYGPPTKGNSPLTKNDFHSMARRSTFCLTSPRGNHGGIKRYPKKKPQRRPSSLSEQGRQAGPSNLTILKSQSSLSSNNSSMWESALPSDSEISREQQDYSWGNNSESSIQPNNPNLLLPRIKPNDSDIYID